MSQAVLITGAQLGTGYGIAEFFAKQGWDVFITSRKSAEAEASAKKLAETYGVFAKGYECNIRNEQQVIDIFADIDQTGRFVETVVLSAPNNCLRSTSRFRCSKRAAVPNFIQKSYWQAVYEPNQNHRFNRWFAHP